MCENYQRVSAVASSAEYEQEGNPPKFPMLYLGVKRKPNHVIITQPLGGVYTGYFQSVLSTRVDVDIVCLVHSTVLVLALQLDSDLGLVVSQAPLLVSCVLEGY